MKKTTVILLTAIMSPFISAQQPASWNASRELVEKLSKGGTVINYYEEKVPAYTLPDPLINSNGSKITSPDEWNGRRQEILELFRSNVFGRVPATPYHQEFRVVNEDKNALGGAATLKEVDITVSAEGESLVIHLFVFIPNKIKGSVPAFLLINNRGSSFIDPTRKIKSELWPVEEVVARGYAMAAFNNSDVDPDNFDGFKDGIHSIFDRGQRSGDSWGTLAAWAWGASRCMDYLVTDKAIDGKKVVVAGHSRGGKTALWAGAEDTRFAMVISNESGCGGAALARRKYGETVERINDVFPHWFCTNFRKYNNNEDNLPVDMHMLLALTAPRCLYVACADEDLWGDPKGSYLSLQAAVPVFRLLRKITGIRETMPPLNTPVSNGNIAFHIRDGSHDLLLKDWNMFMDFADKVMK